MIRLVTAGVSLALLVGLSGCEGFNPARDAVDPHGPVSLKGSGYVLPNDTTAGPRSSGQFRIFEISYKRSWDDQVLISGGTSVPDAPTHARQMAVDGINLADANCKDFFDTAGENQKDILFIKDVVGGAGTLATGVIALAAHGNAATAAVVGLSTATLYGGIDVYTRNFLFGSDNIDHVRTLIANALAAHAKAALDPALSSSPWTFGDAADVVADHQDICRPAHIRALVLDAIQKGNPVASTSSSAPLSSGGGPPVRLLTNQPLSGTGAGSRHVTVQIAQ